MEFYFARMYRRNTERKFGNLFSAQNNGCPYLEAGIGNISFVKDLMTRSVLPNNFIVQSLNHIPITIWAG